MHVLSDYHLLLQAKEHIVVVAVPLIPFSDSESMPIEGDDLAIVYITPEGEYKIFEAH